MSRPYYSTDTKRRKKAPPLSGPPTVEVDDTSNGVQRTTSNAKGNTYTTSTGPGKIAPPLGIDQLGPGGVGAAMPPDLASYPHARPIFDPESEQMRASLNELNRIGINAKLTGAPGVAGGYLSKLNNPQTPIQPNELSDEGAAGTVENRPTEAPGLIPGGTPAPPPPVPGQQAMSPEDAQYQAERQRYMDEMKNGPHKQGKASQVLFQIADAMANFGRGMQGQAMQPFRWLGEAKDERRNALAAQRFAPFEQQHQERLHDQEVASQQNYRASQAIKNVADANKANRPDMTREYREVNGKTMSRVKGSSGPWEEEKQLYDPTKEPIKQQLDTGETFYSTGDKIADRKYKESLDQAQMQLRAGEINQQEYDKYQNNMEQWGNTTRGNQEKRDSLNTQADTEEQNADSNAETSDQRKQRANETDDPVEKQRLLKEADEYAIKSREARVKARGLRKQASGIKDPPQPKTPGRVQAPTVKSGASSPKRVTKEQFEQIKQQNPNMTEKQLRDMAKREGFEID